jgi:hypothetical protein
MADMSQLYSYESLHRNPKFAAEEQKPNPMGERFLVDSQKWMTAGAVVHLARCVNKTN